jgi:hypothetical protein
LHVRTDKSLRPPWLRDEHAPAPKALTQTMCAVPILTCSQWTARATIMVRGLLAPLSPREVRELLYLFHGRDFQPDPAAFKRFVMLGLVDEKPNGFALTELGRQRLDAEQKSRQ